jgi:hypothetical protein
VPGKGQTKSWQRALPVAGEGANENLAKAVDTHPPATAVTRRCQGRGGEREREYGTKDKSRGRKPRVLLIFLKKISNTASRCGSGAARDRQRRSRHPGVVVLTFTPPSLLHLARPRGHGPLAPASGGLCLLPLRVV